MQQQQQQWFLGGICTCIVDDSMSHTFMMMLIIIIIMRVAYSLSLSERQTKRQRDKEGRRTNKHHLAEKKYNLKRHRDSLKMWVDMVG